MNRATAGADRRRAGSSGYGGAAPRGKARGPHRRTTAGNTGYVACSCGGLWFSVSWFLLAADQIRDRHHDHKDQQQPREEWTEQEEREDSQAEQNRPRPEFKDFHIYVLFGGCENARRSLWTGAGVFGVCGVLLGWVDGGVRLTHQQDEWCGVTQARRQAQELTCD